jgi:hypothetical protein
MIIVPLSVKTLPAMVFDQHYYEHNKNINFVDHIRKILAKFEAFLMVKWFQRRY